jgi:hypothetical protein
VLSVGPEVGVVPGKLVESGAAQRGAHEAGAGIEDWELIDHSLSFRERLVGRQEGRPIRTRPSDGGNKLHDCLVWDACGLVGDPLPE